MEKKEIAELFMKGIDCSQVVVGAFAEELGITTEEAYKMSAAFGGGMGTPEKTESHLTEEDVRKLIEEYIDKD